MLHASLYLSQEDIKSRMSSEWTRDTYLPKCQPHEENEDGKIYGKHDAIFTLIMAKRDTDNCYDHHIAQRQSIFIKTLVLFMIHEFSAYASLEPSVSQQRASQSRAQTLHLMQTALWALLDKRAGIVFDLYSERYFIVGQVPGVRTRINVATNMQLKLSVSYYLQDKTYSGYKKLTHPS